MGAPQSFWPFVWDGWLYAGMMGALVSLLVGIGGGWEYFPGVEGSEGPSTYWIERCYLVQSGAGKAKNLQCQASLGCGTSSTMGARPYCVKKNYSQTPLSFVFNSSWARPFAQDQGNFCYQAATPSQWTGTFLLYLQVYLFALQVCQPALMCFFSPFTQDEGCGSLGLP